MRARSALRRAFAPAGVAIFGLIAVALGVAIKTGFMDKLKQILGQEE